MSILSSRPILQDGTNGNSASGTVDRATSLLDIRHAILHRDVLPVGDGPVPTSGSPIRSKTISSSVLTDKDALVLTGHSSEVFTCTWNPRFSLLATGSGDRSARIWPIPSSVVPSTAKAPAAVTLKHVGGDEGKENDVTTVDWSPDGLLLATGSYDGGVRIWSQEGDLLHELRLHRGPLFTVKWNSRGDLLVSAGVDRTIRVWSYLQGTRPAITTRPGWLSSHH